MKLICLDLHGVLVDATKGFAKALGEPNAFGDPVCVYDDPKNLGDYHAVVQYPGFLQHLEQADIPFWAELETLPHVPELIATCKDLADEVVIVSHSSSGNCYAGSKAIADKLGLDFISTEHKHYLARDGVLLIDDYEKNVNAFIAAGGSAITFPQKWNQYHEYTDFKHIRAILERYKSETLNPR